MARLNDDAQWIVLMGFIVSFSLFFLAIVVNQSTVVGQTTAEAVSEFPKHDIRGVRDVSIQSGIMDDIHDNGGPFYNRTNITSDIRTLSLIRQDSVVNVSSSKIGDYTFVTIHYNNGVTDYDESWTSP